MSDKIRCPRCKIQAFTNARYALIRDEFILFEGKCANCGFEPSAESLYEQLTKKFDLDKDFEHLEEALDYIVRKLKSEEEETKKRICETLIKIYEEKADKSWDVDLIENYLYKKIKYEEELNSKKYRDEEKFHKLGSWFSTKGGIKERKDYFRKAAEYYEQAVQLDPTETAYHYCLSDSYEGIGEFDKAIEHLDLWFELQSKTEIPVTPISQKIKEFTLNNYLKSKSEILFKKGDYQKVIELVKGVNFTPEIMAQLCEGSKVKIDGIEVDYATYDAKQKNVDVQHLLLRAYVKLSDLDKALQTYDGLIYTDPDYKDLFNQLVVDGDSNDFDFFCNVIYLLLEKNITKAYELVKQIDINQLQKEHSDLETVAFLIFISFLKARVYFEYVLASGKKETKLLEDAEKYFKLALSALESWYLGGDIWDNSWPPKEIWESYFGSVESIRPEAHKYRGMIFETLGDSESAFVEYKNAQNYEPNDQVLMIKIDNLRSGFFNDLNIETQRLAKIDAEEIPLETTKRIISLLYSIKDSFPEHYGETKELVEKLGDTRPYILLNPLRRIAEEYFKKIYKGEESLDFIKKVEGLWKKNEINTYIKNLLIFIWSLGSKGSHPLPQYIKDLKLEDIEVLVSAGVRFLNWYHEKYSKKK